MARPYWSGQIQISLVQFGVSLYTATESKSGITFNQISRSTGERVRYQKTAGSEEGAATVTKDDIVKGYEYSKGQYVIIEPSELENLRVPSKHTIEVSQFIDMAELNPEYVEKPYFVTPLNDMQAEAFAVVREALTKTGKAAIGKVAFQGRENIVAVTAAPGSRGMMAYTLRYENELRNANDYFREIKDAPINEDSLEMAEALIKRKTAKFEIGKFQDGYETAVKELVDAKLKHMPIPVEETPLPQTGKVINLMDALRKSLGDDAASGAKKPPVKETAGRKGISVVKTPAKAAKRKTA
jgi:DNA end-binding protein Ku